jgi:glyceraldehyde 3-phosphate dehydrogenase
MSKNMNLLGINGLGRIAKLTLWEHIRLKHFDGFVVNIGREVGTGLEAVGHSISRDSTYGSLKRFLYGYSKHDFDFKILDQKKGLLEIDGMPVTILRSARNPEEITWRQYGVRLVIDCTGAHKDPTIPSGSGKPSVRGHLAAGAEKVIISAPTKIADKAAKMPDDCGMFIYGINHLDFHPGRHHVISAASCTTTGLSHMMKPLLENSATNRILTASMSTIHAATGSQSILDSSPKKDAIDLRKNRSIFNNIILTSTGAAKALEQVLPEIKHVGFIADSVRIPTNTTSLIVLNVTFSSPMQKSGLPIVNHTFLNKLYKEAAGGSQKGLLVFSEKQNVSADIIGFQASVVLEGHDTHTRTGFLNIPSELLAQYEIKKAQNLRLPVTHAKIFGWYDNEYGSYVYSLGKLTVYIDKHM